MQPIPVSIRVPSYAMRVEALAIKKVLLVNDCKLECLIMKDMLVTLGYDVKTADENECMKLVRSFDPDILIANRTMNRLNGDMIIETVKTYKPEIQGILSSCSPINLEDYKEQKVDAVIQTPIEAENIKKILMGNVQTFEAASVAEPQTAAYKTGEKPEIKLEVKPEIKPDTIRDIPPSVPPVKYVFCPFCGGKLIDVPGDFAFCPFCGHKLNVS